MQAKILNRKQLAQIRERNSRVWRQVIPREALTADQIASVVFRDQTHIFGVYLTLEGPSEDATEEQVFSRTPVDFGIPGSAKHLAEMIREIEHEKVFPTLGLGRRISRYWTEFHVGKTEPLQKS